MEMQKVIAREGRDAKNLLLYHLSSEDDLTESKNLNKIFKLNWFDWFFLFPLFFVRNKCQKTTNKHKTVNLTPKK